MADIGGLSIVDDVQLIEQAQCGDLTAYETLVRRYQGQALRAAYLILGQRQEAEDAAQDAFVRAWHALDRFDRKRSFRPWLLTIVTNQARDRARARGRRRRLFHQLVSDRTTSNEPSPERSVIAQEQIAAVLDELQEMPEKDRIVLSYRYLLDLPTVEIAEILDIPHGTVRSRISRALDRLREQLASSDRPNNQGWDRSANG